MELHKGHPGITRMKSLARMYVWWPGINADIEKSVRLCRECQQVQSSPLHPWKWQTQPWARLHVDLPDRSRAHTALLQWIKASCTSSTSSSAAMDVLWPLFARFGVLETVVTDNIPGFVSQEFEHFLRSNGIHHLTSAPYHPASNGLAERAV